MVPRQKKEEHKLSQNPFYLICQTRWKKETECLIQPL